MNAIFAFSTVTTKQNAKDAMNTCLAQGTEQEEVCRELGNTGPVNAAQIDVGFGPWLIPMHGMYAFVVVFPLMLAMSIAYQRYSGLLDVLMVLAPERYRNHVLLRKLAMQSKPQYRHNDNAQVPTPIQYLGHKSASDIEETIVGTPAIRGKSRQRERSARDMAKTAYAAQRDASSADLLEVTNLDQRDTTSPEKVVVQLMAGSALQHAGADDRNSRSDVHQSYGQLKMTIERDPSLVDFIEALDRQMKRWKRIATNMTVLLMFTGLLLALLFVGSFDPSGQEDWIKGVGKKAIVSYSSFLHRLNLFSLGVFIVLSAIITSPLVMLYLSIRAAWKAHQVDRKAKVDGVDPPIPTQDTSDEIARTVEEAQLKVRLSVACSKPCITYALSLVDM
jgi:hypothetical protein